MHIDSATDSLSYWHATAEPMIPGNDLPATAEAVVIGGGMLGCWTAYWLAKSGVQVVVLEKSAVGWGATGRNGGFLIGGGAIGYQRMIDLLGRENAARLYTLTMRGQNLAYQVIEEEGIDCDLRKPGQLNLALNDDSFNDFIALKQLLHDDGVEIDVLSRDELQEYIHTPLGESIVGSFHVENGAMLHSSRYIAGIARAAERHGARFVQATAKSISARPDGATIATSVGNIDTSRIVVALNAWTDSLIPEMKGVIVPTRGQILSYKPTRPLFPLATGTDFTPTGEYWHQTPDGSIIIGGCRADALNRDSDVREMVFTTDVIAKIENVLPSLFPELTDLEVDRTWAGLMAFTPDGLPVVDHTKESTAVWYGGGFNGHGMPFGPSLGQLLANSILSGETAPELAMLSSSRASLA